jgi:hypothetical protein
MLTALLYLAAKLVHVGVDVDVGFMRLLDKGIGPPTRRCLVSSLQWGGGTFPRDVKPLGLDIWWSIDRVDACVTESYME